MPDLVKYPHDKWTATGKKAKGDCSPATCSICGEAAWGGTKCAPSDKCFKHFGCVCPECGHEAFWIKTKKNPKGRYVCFAIEPWCDWVSTTFTKPLSRQNDQG